MTDWNNFNEGLKPPKPKPPVVKMTRAELEVAAMAAQERIDRYTNNKILWYVSCGDKHLAFHSSRKPIRILFGGNRSGKSFAGMAELIFRACLSEHPFTKEPFVKKGRYRIFTTKFQVAEEFIVPLLQEYIPKSCLLNGSWQDSYDSRYHLLRLKNGCTIDIMTYDQEVTVTASVALDGVWADEEMPERMFSETITRLISRKGKMWLTVTPLYSLTWAMKFWERGDDPTVDVFRISIYDNPHLPPAERDAIIQNWPENERAARVSGEFLEFAGLIYKELDNHVHLIDVDPKLPMFHWPVIMTMDPHPRKATVVTWAYVDPQGSAVFFDELEMKGTAREITAAIKDKERQHRGPTLLRLIDPAAKAQGSNIAYQTDTLREFEKEGLFFSLADNSEAGYNIVHEYLAYDKSRPLGPLNRPRCYFTKAVPKTWDGMTHLLWDEWRAGNTLRDEKERPKDFKKDFPDCVRYTLASRPRSSYDMTPKPIGNIAKRRR